MLFRSLKGIIALDLDGTVTVDSQKIEPEVIQALQHLAQNNWAFIFITGRPYQWSAQLLNVLPFAFTLAVQNGALILELPSKKIQTRHYLSLEHLPAFERLCQAQKTDFAIYTDLENKETCYYRTNYFSATILDYIRARATKFGENWQIVQDFNAIPVTSFPAIKCFAKETEAHLLSAAFEKELGLHAPPNRDPFNPDYFVIQATHPQATKGEALNTFSQLLGASLPIIAAGDDYNDYTMLQRANVKVVMANAPAQLLNLADIIAPPATQKGIIEGLTLAVKQVKKNEDKAHV